MGDLTPELYGRVLELLPQFYDVVLLDLGTGLVDDLALFGIRRAEQALIVTEPKFVTTEKVLDALPYIESKGCWDGAGDGARLERPADARPRAALAVERPVGVCHAARRRRAARGRHNVH